MPKADAVFEGGGVRGIAFVGAVQEAEARGYEWQNLAGTSAGAIVASLLACRYTAQEMQDIIWGLDFEQLTDEGWEDRFSRLLFFFMNFIPKVGAYARYALSIVKDLGIYEGQRFQQLMEGYLAKKGVHTYKDLLMPGLEDQPRYRYRLRVIASDLTAGKMLILPDDIRSFGINPDDLSVALSIRMSMSIPIFFEPVTLYNASTGLRHVIVDGGILSNYPIWLFDVPPGEAVGWPTFGFNLFEPAPDEDVPPDPLQERPQVINNPIALVKAIWGAVFSAVDKRYVSQRHWARTIAIDTVGVKTTEFNLSDAQKRALLESGQRATRAFLDKFDFEQYLRAWRGGSPSEGATEG